MDAETKNFIKEEIESLGIMIAKGFEYQGKSIEAVEGRLETVRQELTLEIRGVKERLTTVEGKLVSVEDRLVTVETKIDRETEMLVVLENNLMDRDLVGEDKTQQVLHRVERIEDHLKLSHSLEPA